MSTMLATLLILLAAITTTLTANNYHGHQVVEVNPVTRRQSLALENLLHTQPQLDVWRYVRMPSTQADIRVSPEQKSGVLTFLQAHGVPHRVKVPDVHEAIQQQRSSSRNHNKKNVDFDDYNTLEDIDLYLEGLADSDPELVTLHNLGESFQQRPLLAVQLSTDAGAGRPALFLTAAANPREWISTAVLLNFINYLISGYGEDDEITELLDHLDFYIQPVLNVDGYVYTFDEEGDRLWRKTRSDNEGSECIGTDPNRNFGFEWEGDDDPCSDNYPGSEAFSEQEVQAVADFVGNLPDVQAYLAYHSYGQLLMFPYGYTEEQIPDYDHLFELLGETADAIEAVENEVYTVGSLADIVGLNRGSSADYMYGELNIPYTVGVELRDTGDAGHLLPADQIAPTSQENFAGLLVIADHVMHPHEGGA